MAAAALEESPAGDLSASGTAHRNSLTAQLGLLRAPGNAAWRTAFVPPPTRTTNVIGVDPANRLGQIVPHILLLSRPG